MAHSLYNRNIETSASEDIEIRIAPLRLLFKTTMTEAASRQNILYMSIITEIFGQQIWQIEQLILHGIR